MSFYTYHNTKCGKSKRLRTVDTVINVKGAEATQQRSSRHLWEGERRIIVRLMFPDPIHDMQEVAHRRDLHDFERFAARLEARGKPLHVGIPAQSRDRTQVEDASQARTSMAIDLGFAMHAATRVMPFDG